MPSQGGLANYVNFPGVGREIILNPYKNFLWAVQCFKYWPVLFCFGAESTEAHRGYKNFSKEFSLILEYGRVHALNYSIMGRKVIYIYINYILYIYCIYNFYFSALGVEPKAFALCYIPSTLCQFYFKAGSHQDTKLSRLSLKLWFSCLSLSER